MAQLREDEWPTDGEQTTSEREGDLFKRDGSNPPGRPTGQSRGGSTGDPSETTVNHDETRRQTKDD